MPRATTSSKSPFLTKAYGGYTSDQEAFYTELIGTPRETVILDPMSGQGYPLSRLALNGATLWLGDLNPAPLMLASLRDPELLGMATDLVERARSLLNNLVEDTDKDGDKEYIEDWLAPEVRSELSEYRSLLDFGNHQGPFSFEGDFWAADTQTRFLACLPVMSARELVCARTSDNSTWFKKGGLARTRHIYEAVSNAIDRWLQYAEAAEVENIHGQLHVWRMNSEAGMFGNAPVAHSIITSPPYANRLDYTRMWAPELAVASAMWSCDSSDIKRQLIGSTVVQGRKHWDQGEDLLSASTVASLEAIRTETDSWASATYYYPFFKNYAVALAKSMYQIVDKLHENGIMVIFIRDTVRKDVLFSAKDLLDHVLIQLRGLEPVRVHKKVIKAHVGLMRRASTNSVYGLAQHEWWLAYRKGR